MRYVSADRFNRAQRALMDALRQLRDKGEELTRAKEELEQTRSELKEWKRRAQNMSSQSVVAVSRRSGKTLQTLEAVNATLERCAEFASELDENKSTKAVARRLRAILGVP